MSNLIKPQLHPCQSAAALHSFFHHLLSCDSLILSLTPPPNPLLLPFTPSFFSIFISFSFLRVMASGSILTRPSARAQTNQSRVVLFHKDQKQLVSFHVSLFFLVCLCRPFPVCLLTLEFAQVQKCLMFFHTAYLHAS